MIPDYQDTKDMFDLYFKFIDAILNFMCSTAPTSPVFQGLGGPQF